MPNLCVIDLETAGLDRTDPIVEMGAVLLNLDTFEIHDLFHYLIKETHFGEKHRNAWIFHNSNLSFDDVMVNGVPFENIKTDLEAAIANYSITAYNQQFDFNMLRQRGFHIPDAAPDPMHIATTVLNIKHVYYGQKWPSVQECLNFFQIHGIEPHRALEDARLEAHIIIELIKRNHYPLETIKKGK